MDLDHRKKVFVTGASSLLGTNLIIELINQQYSVKGLVRKLESYRGIMYENIELVKGDLFGNLDVHLEGCDYVIHAAAQTDLNLCNYYEFYRTNVEGTIRLVSASIRQNVAKLIYISTANTVGYGDSNNPGNESQAIRDTYLGLYYSRSKLEAENYLLGQTDKIKIVIVNPTFMIGAYDTKPTSGKIILEILSRKLIPVPPGGRNFVHVMDVASGVVQSLAHGRNGEKYLLAGHNLSYDNFVKQVLNKGNRNPILIKIPKFILILIGYFGDILRKMGIRTILSSTSMKIISIETFYSNMKSIEELNLQYHTIDQAIMDALAFFKENKYYQVEGCIGGPEGKTNDKGLSH